MVRLDIPTETRKLCSSQAVGKHNRLSPWSSYAVPCWAVDVDDLTLQKASNQLLFVFAKKRALFWTRVWLRLRLRGSSPPVGDPRFRLSAFDLAFTWKWDPVLESTNLPSNGHENAAFWVLFHAVGARSYPGFLLFLEQQGAHEYSGFHFFTQNFVWFYKIVWWSDRLERFRSCSPWPTLFPKMEMKVFLAKERCLSLRQALNFVLFKNHAVWKKYTVGKRIVLSFYEKKNIGPRMSSFSRKNQTKVVRKTEADVPWPFSPRRPPRSKGQNVWGASAVVARLDRNSLARGRAVDDHDLEFMISVRWLAEWTLCIIGSHVFEPCLPFWLCYQPWLLRTPSAAFMFNLTRVQTLWARFLFLGGWKRVPRTWQSTREPSCSWLLGEPLFLLSSRLSSQAYLPLRAC